MEKVDVLGCKFDNVNMQEAVDICKGFIKSDKGNLIVTPNPEIVMRAKDDEEFKNAVDELFEELEAENPEHFAVRQYRKYKLAAGVIR